MCTIRFRSMLAGLLIVLTLSPAIMAFEYSGQAWCCDTIKYLINPTNPSLSCGDPGVGNWFQTIVRKAANTWNAQGTQFQIIESGTTTVGCSQIQNPDICAGIKDGQNTVSMAAGCNWVDNNIIAYSTWWYWTQGDSACCIFESDICFNNNTTWFTDQGTCSGSCYDLESVALHEFGHWIAANHEPHDGLLGYRPVMFPNFNFCEIRRTITQDDSALLAWAYDPTGAIDPASVRCELVHAHPPYGPPPPHTPCADGGECLPGGPFCDSLKFDPCLLVCPASDVVFKVVVKDSCGNPVCDMTGTFLEIDCQSASPCPNEEANWPRIFPDSCDAATGTHFFSVDAGESDCALCGALIYCNGVAIAGIPVRFLDNDGDFQVTNGDFVGGRPCEDFNCNFGSDAEDQAIWQSHLGHACPDSPCDPGPAFCDSTEFEFCLLVCPASDIVYTVTLKDSCGNPICDLNGTWLDFSGCPAQACPDEEPNWPKVFPDSCDAATGKHYFTVDASALDCATCEAILFVNGQACNSVEVRFLDNNGDFCVTEEDFVGGRSCDDLNCNFGSDPGDAIIWSQHFGHCCPSVEPSCCVGEVGNVDCDQQNLVDIRDLVSIINTLFITFQPFCCKAEANIDADPDCIIDIRDAVALINILYITFDPLPQCSCP